jgi:UDP-2,3-diacylglucosamine pyrophosphatase LpxH
MSVTIAGELVKLYVSKYPNAANAVLARMLTKDNPELFTVENARTMVRYYRGALGKKHRNYIADKTFVRNKKTDDPFEFIPKSYANHRDKWHLPTSIKRVAVWGDLHIPYHDTPAVKAAIKLAKDEKVNAIFLNGDVMDFFGLSFYEKNPKNRPRLSEELESARTFLKGLRKTFPNIPIYWIDGNHEHRLERYLAVKAPELLDTAEFRVDVLLRMAEYGITYLGFRTKCYFGKLLVEHGDRLRGTGGVNPARSVRLKYKRSTLVNHFHKLSVDSGKQYDGDVMTCYSNGCLCELEPEYMEVNEHVHGVCHVDMLGGGDYKVRQFQIIDGKVY